MLGPQIFKAHSASLAVTGQLRIKLFFRISVNSCSDGRPIFLYNARALSAPSNIASGVHVLIGGYSVKEQIVLTVCASRIRTMCWLSGGSCVIVVETSVILEKLHNRTV
jgi:hypothetical protein